MAIPSRCARGTNRRPRRAEVVVLGHPRGDKGDDRGLPHRREVAASGGVVGAVGDGLRGGHHELGASAESAIWRSSKRPDGFRKPVRSSSVAQRRVDEFVAKQGLHRQA
jgi:hypothetical protein